MNLKIDLMIQNLVRDQTVLEVGGLGDLERYSENDFKVWRHNQIKTFCTDIYGIDINQPYINIAQKKGFNYTYGDIEKYESLSEDIRSKSFDIVLLVDVIEHLNNVGLGLETIKKVIKTDGKIFITTPNPWSINNLFSVLIGKQPSVYADHTNFMVEQNFKAILKRLNLNIIGIEYFTFIDQGSKVNNIKSKIINFLGHFNKYFHTNIYVLVSK